MLIYIANAVIDTEGWSEADYEELMNELLRAIDQIESLLASKP